MMLLVPATHCLTHYGDGAKIWGLLRILWMMDFGLCMFFICCLLLLIDNIRVHTLSERWNKKCKNLTANKNEPIKSLANSLVRDATARFFRLRRGDKATRVPKMITTEVSDAETSLHTFSPRLLLSYIRPNSY